MMIDALVPDRLRYLLQSLQINEALRELKETRQGSGCLARDLLASRERDKPAPNRGTA